MNQRPVEFIVDAVLYPMLIIDAVLLAVLESLFLPLRFDGRLLPELGAVPAPIAVLVAAVTTPLLVSQAARWTVRMGTPGVFAAVPLVAWVLVVLIFGAYGPGGDRVMTQDWRTLALIACGALPSAFVLGRALGKARLAQARLESDRQARAVSAGAQ